MVGEAGAGKSERQSQKGLEILDFENHGALYGRFLLASQAKTAGEVANIINPAITLEHPKVRYKQEGNKFFLKDRDYNPVFENFSLAERKEEWKGIEYSEAYNQWRTKFTGFMINIQDPKRALALKAILSNNKEAKEFTATDADTLFKEFCEGKSDITHFITRVTTNLVSDGKINPANLQELLPHLQWIASGLFGKNTASYGVTRLIELESALHNNPQAVLENLSLNKERINIPTDHEGRILGVLYSLLPQEPIIPTQESKTVIPPAGHQPAPVSKPKEEPDKDKQPLPPPLAKLPIEQLAESAEEPENAKIDIFPIPGKESEFGRMVNLSINGEKSEIIWRQSKKYNNEKRGEWVWEEDAFQFVSTDEAEGSLNIPRGIGLYINNKWNTGSIFITGEKGAEVSIDELEEIEKNSMIGSPIILHVKNPKKASIFGTEGKARFVNFRDKREISIEEAIQRLKKYDGKLDDSTDPNALSSKPIISSPVETQHPKPETTVEETPTDEESKNHRLLFRLKINGEEMGFKFIKVYNNPKFEEYMLVLDEILENDPEYLNIPKGIAVSFHKSLPNHADYITVLGGQGVRLNVKNLRDLDFHTLTLSLQELNSTLSGKDLSEHEGQVCKLRYYHRTKEGHTKEWITQRDLEEYLETIKREKDSQIIPQKGLDPDNKTPNSVESVINLEGKSGFVKELNEKLRENQASHLTLSFPPDQLKEYIASMAKGYKVRKGTIEVDKDNNRITIRGLRISRLGIGFNLDLIIDNDAEGIAAKIQKFDLDFLARRSTIQADVESQLKTINSAIRKHLDQQIATENSFSWSAKKVSIAEGRVLIQFEKNRVIIP